MKLKPLADRVLVLPDEVVEKTKSGLYIPDTAKERPIQGTVVAIGNGKKDEPMTVKINDKVLYGRHSGSPINVDEKEYLIMREIDIFAVI